MKLAEIIARVYVAFIGAFGFLFGQLFFGTFSFAASLAGISGVLIGVFGSPLKRRMPLVLGLCVAGVFGVGMDSINYYRELDIPGNYYPWVLFGPFLAALFFIGYLGVNASAKRLDA